MKQRFHKRSTYMRRSKKDTKNIKPICHFRYHRDITFRKKEIAAKKKKKEDSVVNRSNEFDEINVQTMSGLRMCSLYFLLSIPINQK